MGERTAGSSALRRTLWALLLVVPVLHGDGLRPHWLDVTALAFVGAAATAFALWRQQGHPLVPAGDPHLPAALRYGAPLAAAVGPRVEPASRERAS